MPTYRFVLRNAINYGSYCTFIFSEGYGLKNKQPVPVWERAVIIKPKTLFLSCLFYKPHLR